jgi:glutamine amidotransferase
MIGIINMHTNNINCFIKILNRLKKKYIVINKYEDYNENIEKLIIPGIGSYNSCVNYIINNNIHEVIYKHLKQNKQIMGICIGMQILTSTGIEGGETNGLDILKNTNVDIITTDYILPHIGWSKINVMNKNDPIFKNVNVDADFYFVHSYNVISKNKDIVSATSNYGKCEFISIIKTETIFATQFHPEKSGPNGIKLIENFVNL